MDANNEVLKQMILFADSKRLGALLTELGYPRVKINPRTLERAYSENGDNFLIPFAALVNEGMELDRADGATTETKSKWTANDWKTIFDGVGGLAKNVLPYLNIDLGGGQSAAQQAYYNSVGASARSAADAQTNPWPWVIGGIVMIGIIIAIIVSKK